MPRPPSRVQLRSLPLPLRPCRAQRFRARVQLRLLRVERALRLGERRLRLREARFRIRLPLRQRLRARVVGGLPVGQLALALGKGCRRLV